MRKENRAIAQGIKCHAGRNRDLREDLENHEKQRKIYALRFSTSRAKSAEIPWPMEEARRLALVARAVRLAPSHKERATHGDDCWQSICNWLWLKCARAGSPFTPLMEAILPWSPPQASLFCCESDNVRDSGLECSSAAGVSGVVALALVAGMVARALFPRRRHHLAQVRC
jgi:hypothetical protein